MGCFPRKWNVVSSKAWFLAKLSLGVFLESVVIENKMKMEVNMGGIIKDEVESNNAVGLLHV